MPGLVVDPVRVLVLGAVVVAVLVVVLVVAVLVVGSVVVVVDVVGSVVVVGVVVVVVEDVVVVGNVDVADESLPLSDAMTARATPRPITAGDKKRDHELRPGAHAPGRRLVAALPCRLARSRITRVGSSCMARESR